MASGDECGVGCMLLRRGLGTRGYGECERRKPLNRSAFCGLVVQKIWRRRSLVGHRARLYGTSGCYDTEVQGFADDSPVRRGGVQNQAPTQPSTGGREGYVDFQVGSQFRGPPPPDPVWRRLPPSL